MTNKIEGKIVVITGASSGLGEQIAYEAASQNAKVVICARREDNLKAVKERCNNLSNFETSMYVLDIASPESVEKVCIQIKAELGGIDVLVNCAGFGLFKEFTAFDMAIAEKMFRVNVLGLMYMTQKIALDMIEQQSGHIINIGSQAGKMASIKSSVYGATKHAVLGFSNALRLELKPFNIKVTTVNPGPIATDFFDIADETGNYLQSVQSFVLQPIPLAKKIVATIGHNRREINAPWIMELANKGYSLFPTMGDFLAGTVFNKK